jgi:rhodanese-related sulfurtransferase
MVSFRKNFLTDHTKNLVMKKILYFVIPLLLIFVATRFYKSGSKSVGESSNAEYCNMSPSEYLKAEQKDVVILDVRTEREYAYGHLENAIVIDIYSRGFKDKISKLDKEKTYYVYCKTGIRSRSAVNYMIKTGFKKVCDLEGGINYLSRAGVKLVQ